MRNMKFVKRIGVAVLAACMVLSCVGCGSSSNKGAAEGTTEIAAEGGQTKISVAAAASLQATFNKSTTVSLSTRFSSTNVSMLDVAAEKNTSASNPDSICCCKSPELA